MTRKNKSWHFATIYFLLQLNRREELRTVETRLRKRNRLPREEVRLREVVTTFIEVYFELQAIPTLNLVLVHNCGWKAQHQRPLILTNLLLERLGAERSVTLHLRENVVACVDYILSLLAVANQHLADAGGLDVVVRLAIQREEELAARVGPNLAIIRCYASCGVALLHIEANIQLLARVEYLECYVWSVWILLGPVAASNLPVPAWLYLRHLELHG